MDSDDDEDEMMMKAFSWIKPGSSQKPRESDASASKQHPYFYTSTGWQITNTRDTGADSSMHNTDPESNTLNIIRLTIQSKIKGIGSDWRTLTTSQSQGNHSTTKSFINKDLDYQLTWTKSKKLPLSISKLKAARYLDFGLEELVPSLWVESEREYDISAVYGITHWWFRRKEFYINKHSEFSDREAVRSYMRILKHPSETIVFHNEDGNPARANIKQALGYLKDWSVKASANSDVKYSFTSAQDGEPLQDDVRLCLGNDLKKAQDHSQRHV
ncbi:hypothetical protein Tco_0534857 [Tanacetum coccineum]